MSRRQPPMLRLQDCHANDTYQRLVRSSPHWLAGWLAGRPVRGPRSRQAYDVGRGGSMAESAFRSIRDLFSRGNRRRQPSPSDDAAAALVTVGRSGVPPPSLAVSAADAAFSCPGDLRETLHRIWPGMRVD